MVYKPDNKRSVTIILNFIFIVLYFGVGEH
jgi:hypothetical protein